METKSIIPNQFTRGMYILFNKEIFTVVDFQHIKMAQRRAHMTVKMKNLLTGKVLEYNLSSRENIAQVTVEDREVTYLYSTPDAFYFLDTNTGEEISLPKGKVGDQRFYMREGDTVSIAESGGEPIILKIPISVELKVVKTPPGIRGDTASGGSKPAELETGLTIKVPLFIKEGDMVKVDTRTDEYLTRVSDLYGS